MRDTEREKKTPPRARNERANARGRRLRSLVANFEHLELFVAAGRAHDGELARALAEQGAGERREEGDAHLAGVGLVDADDLVAPLVARLGGETGDDVNARTTMLVIGAEGLGRDEARDKSNKLRRAEEVDRVVAVARRLGKGTRVRGRAFDTG